MSTQQSDYDRLLQGMHKVQSLADRLMACPSWESLYRCSMEYAREHLGIERCGLFLLDKKNESLIGTFGTNSSGETVDEVNVQIPYDEILPLLQKENTSPQNWLLKEKCDLLEWNGSQRLPITNGWRVTTPVSSDEGIIGLIFNDTAISQSPLDPVKQEILSSYGYLLGNIISRKRSEAEMRSSEEKYRLLFHNNPQPMYVYDLETLQILAVNNAALTHYGYSREEFLEMTIRDFRLQEDIDAFIDTIEKFRSGVHLAGEWRHLRKDGSIIEVEIHTHTVTFAGRKAKLVLAVDITERNRVREEVERLAAFPKFNPNPVIEFDADGKISFLNLATEEMLQSFKVNSIESLLPHNIEEIIKECLATNTSRLRCEIKIDERTLSWSFYPIMSRKIARWVVHCYGGEITERLQLEDQLRHIQKMDSIGQLAGGVAHDFNNILTAIIGYSNLIRMKPEIDTDTVKEAEQITLAAQRASNLTKQLLAFGRRQFVSLKPIDLNQTIENMQGMLHSLTGEKINLQMNFAEKLPSICGDANMIDQVVLNLCVNARDAMPQGGSLLISTSLINIPVSQALPHPEALPGQYIRMRVSDTGVGMDSSTVERIFEPFFTTKALGQGTGLGLATVYGIVKQHKGWIEVKSKVGIGSTFDVFFPVILAEAIAVEPVSSQLQIEKTDKKTSVLIVEDEPAVRMIAKTILSRHGFNIYESENAVDALELWNHHRDEIDILFSDMVMPKNMTGIELAKKLTESKPSLRVVITSGYNVDMIEDNDEWLSQALFLPKPYSASDLVKIIKG